MAKEIRALQRYNENTEQTEIFYPATTTDAIVHPTKRKSLTNVITDIETGIIYDVTANNPTSGPNNDGKWESLSALLSDTNLNTLIPTSVQRGGMSIKFVQSSDNKYIRYNLLATSFTTDTTQWAVDDNGVYVENPEFVYVKADAEGKILWAIRTDGSIYYGAGVPQQVIDYVESRIAALSLDEYEDIVDFLDGIIDKQPIFSNKKVSIIGDSISTFEGYLPESYPSWYPHEDDRSSDVTSVNDTWWKKLIDATDSSLEVNTSYSGSGAAIIEERPDFSSRVPLLGNPDIVLIALGNNDSRYNVEIGDIDFNADSYDLTKFAPAYIKGVQDTIATYPYARIICIVFDMGLNYKNAIKTIAEHYELECIYVDDISSVHPNKAEMQAVYERIYNTYTLTGLLNNKVDKENGKSLIDKNVADGVHYVENPEFINVKLDADKRIIEATKNDGMKYFAVGVNIADVSVEYSIDSPEYVGVFLDGKNHILMAFENDGNVYFGIGVPKQIKKYVDDNINTIQNFLAGFDEGTTLLEYLNDTYGRYVENPEYINVETDAEKKILAGRKTDGTKFESVGFETPSISLDGVGISTVNDPEERMELNLDRKKKIISYRDKDGILHENIGIKTNNFSLTEQGMTDFKQALKDAGFPGGGGNYSDKDLVELPEPEKYALLNLIVEQLPVAGSVDGIVEYYDGMGNYFKKECSVEIQGQTSKIFAQTGGKGNYTLDFPVDIKFGSWVPQDSFHLKGCAKDVTRAILPTSYKWAYMMQEFLHSKPNRVLVDESGITATSATGKRMNDWPNDARCLPDGFPCEVYLNGEYWGLYSFQLKKHRKNYSMDKKDYTSFFLDADDFGADFWNGTINWETFEIKGPKDLVCMDGTAYDGDAPKELIDSTSQYYNPSNSKHVGSALTKSIIESFSVKYLEVKGYIDNSDLVTAKEKFEEYFDVEACIFVYIYNCLMKNNDSVRKNTLWGDYKNGKIVPMLWDLDGMYGTGWIGNDILEPSAYMWTGLYATSAWPLALLWILYQTDIKTAYANLRQNKVIDIDTWHSIMFGWVNRVGEEAYSRDIKKWPETPSYRKNLTDTDYWVEVETANRPGSTPMWDDQTQYAVDDVVALNTYPNRPSNTWCIKYKAVQASIGVCPVTGFYDGFPVIGGCWDSPKRMEKWMDWQIELCDIANLYLDDIDPTTLLADFTLYSSSNPSEIICDKMNISHIEELETRNYVYIEGHITRHENIVSGQTVSTYTISNGAETEQDMEKTYTTISEAVTSASSQAVDVPSENLFYIKAKARNISYSKK